MQCPNCGSTDFRDIDGAAGGIVACNRCDMAVDPGEENVRVGGVAPLEEPVLVPRPDTGATGAEATAETPPESATRAEWDEFASGVGLDPSGYGNKEDLIEAVHAALGSQPDTSLNAPEPEGTVAESTRPEDQGEGA